MKDETFLVHHGQKMHKEHSRVGSCFKESKHIRETSEVVRQKVEAILETREPRQQRMLAVREKAWKTASKQWREDRKSAP